MLTVEAPSATEPTRDELIRWDREIVWHAFTQMAEYEPLIIERAQGCTLVDIDGREYLDGVSQPVVQRARASPSAARRGDSRAARQGGPRHVAGLVEPHDDQAGQAAGRHRAAGPEHVFFSDSGATAVEVALKMALQYWRQRPDPRPEKTTYLALGDAYHGDTLGSVSVGGVERFHAMFRPLLFDVLRAPAPDMYRLPPGVTRENALAHYLRRWKSVLAARTRARSPRW